ncbi:MAG: C2 family cysteine protease [Rivularia sp. (in: cyanobacteria)]
MSIDNAGNLFGSSTSLDITQTWQTIEDTVGLNNADDYYTFTTSSRSHFSLALNDLSTNIDVLLLDDNGSEIANLSSDDIDNQNINEILGIGTYHIQVHQVDDAITSYNLEVKNNYIPQEFQFDTEVVDSGIKLTDTKIFDDDGVDDIRKVDFWLKKQGGYWKKFGTVSEFNSNSDGSIGFDYEISNLEEGKYYIWGRATDNSGARSNGWGKAIDVEKIVNPELENVAPTKLDFTIEAKSGGIELKNTNVFDANGIDNLERVDFQLKAEDGEWIDIQDVIDFTDNGNDTFGFEYSIDSLQQGNYELKATARDRDGAASETLKSYFRVKNTTPTDLRFEVEVVEDGVRLKDTKVLDDNGVNDLSRVDFWLKKEGGNWENIDDAVEFTTKEDGSISFDYSIESLEKGDYVLWARTRDRANDYSNSWQQSFNIGNAAPSQLDFNLKQIDGGVELVNTTVFDPDGTDDLERIDFQLKQDDGEWVEIQDALEFDRNQDGSISFDYSINSLQQGDYQLKATAYDKAGASGDTLTTFFNVKNARPEDLQFDIEAIEGGVRVTDGKVFDANGIEDLTRVDFWLKKDDEDWLDIDDAVEFRENTDGSFSFDYSVNSLEAGDYVLWARTRDKVDSYSNSWEKSFQIVDQIPTEQAKEYIPIPQPEQNWFDQNIQDASIRALSKSLFSDNNLDRNDMITILRDAKDNGAVDSAEITDLRTIIDNASELGIQDYVTVLSSKVVYGDTANKSGNLQAGSSAEQLDKLINKWFLGSERAQTSYTYRYAQGSLFQNGISHEDIRQGYINNCFFLAGLGATLVKSPEIIENMFIDNGDGTFTVRFYNNGVADYVTVDRYLPTNDLGNFVYANAGDYYGNINNELWVTLAEKAYAQVNESGWINQDNTNSYDGIGNAGYLKDAFKHITGKKAALGRILNFDRVVDAFNSGEIIGFGSKSTGIESNIVASHAYALIDYNPQTQKFTLLNPWSTDNNALKSRTLELSWSQISSNFSYWDSTISNLVST